MKPLYKTTIVIWSEDSTRELELSDLAREAEQGAMYCAHIHCGLVELPESDHYWDGTEFFGAGEDEEA